MTPQTIDIGDFVLDINEDDRGRIVAEVFHRESGKTVGITECDTTRDAKHWGKRLIEMQTAKAE